ncbi:hypothetical protein IB229_21180 [Pseudomonas sp. PDM14]|uniref:TorF family putative porin n=1 Tax=Pseudomonas sp. PDM14 TaxID=2769288 RepID=UPI0017841726|nr:TorF family putative porin [Pseudomonas sp. PDM14]MBD9485501.1 hypothetical protein [Pseudomonas sp. PDM14]
MTHRKRVVLTLGLFTASSLVQAQVMQRELGSYDLQLGTTATRSMAQGLVQPIKTGAFHGGLDLTHESGWYIGNWTPSFGVHEGGQLQLDSYTGFKRPLDQRFGYEVGLIRYSHPGFSERDSNEYYAGLTLLDSRFGAAFSNAPGRSDSTLLADLALGFPLAMDVTLKYANHALDTPVNLADGRSVRVFNDWSLNLSRPWAGIDLNLSYTSSNLAGLACAAYSGYNAHCEDYFMLKAQRTLF